MLHVFKRIVFANHRNAVAILQAQVVCAEKFGVATRNTTDVYAISVAQLQRTKLFAIEHRTGDNHHLRLHFLVDVVPVYLVFVPIFIHFLPQQQLHSAHFVVGCYHKHVVT